MWKRLTAAALVLALAGAAAAQPTRQCVYGMSICESYASADAVFVGTVTRIVPATITMWQTDSDYDQTAYVAVEKVYKGRPGRRVVLRQLGRRHAQKFIQNSRYLFYANYDRAARFWEVRPCGNTRMAAYVQNDLRFLNALPAAAARTRVSGEVVHVAPEPDEPQSMARLPGVRLKLRGGGREYEATTGDDGVYEIYDLPPGRYKVEVRVPAGLAFFAVMHSGPRRLERARELEFELGERGCAGLSILLKTDETIRPSGQGIGRLFGGGLFPPGPANFLAAAAY